MGHETDSRSVKTGYSVKVSNMEKVTVTDKIHKRIHYYVHGRGRGHASRTLRIVTALREAAFEVDVFAGADAVSLLDDHFHVNPVESLLPGSALRLGKTLLTRLRSGLARAARDRPFLVISDGDLPGILTATIRGIPSIAVGHAELFSQTERPGGVSPFPWAKEKWVARLSALTASRHVAVHFRPATPLTEKTLVAAPAVNVIAPREPLDVDAVCYFRDDNGTHIVKELVRAGLRPWLFTNSKPQIEGADVKSIDRETFEDALARTKIVVASAGSQLISECVLSGIPFFALYKANDSEQRLNVEMLAASGIGQGESFEQFRPEALLRFVEDHREGGSRTNSNLPMPAVDTAVLQLVNRLHGGALAKSEQGQE